MTCPKTQSLLSSGCSGLQVLRALQLKLLPVETRTGELFHISGKGTNDTFLCRFAMCLFGERKKEREKTLFAALQYKFVT